MYTLFYDQGRASLAPHVLLSELGVAYRLQRVDVDAGENRRPEYLRLNPSGEVPTFVDGELVLPEAVAICLYLADAHQLVDLERREAQVQRAQLCRWLCYLGSALQPTLMAYHYPQARVDDEAAAASVRSAAERRMNAMFDLLDAELEQRPFLAGPGPTAADYYLLMLARWSRSAGRPARTLPHLGRVLGSLCQRQGVIRAFDEEGLSQPYV